MNERISQPFTAYNNSGSISTLVGNWQEEACLKELTGTGRTKTVSSSGGATKDTIYAVWQDMAMAEPTHTRVVEHSEQLETQQLLKAARAQEGTAAAGGSFETTQKADFKAHDLSGITVGSRVMKTSDGGPVQRDPTFLAEAKVVAPAQAGKMGGFGFDTSLLKARIGDPALPITVYTEAAAKSTFSGQFYGTATLNKFQPMNRNDQFTKFIGDINKQQEGL